MRFKGLLLSLVLCSAAHGQAPQPAAPPPLYTKAQLELKRKQYQDAINETEKELSEIKKDKNATVGQLRALQSKLSQRQSLIANINDEIGDIDNSIRSSSKEVGTLKQRLDQQKIKYAQSMRYAYETRSSFGMLAFLFSSADFNDAMRRMKYLKKFRDFRRQQVDQIKSTQTQLQHKIGVLNAEKVEKDELLGKQVEQKKELIKETDQTNQVIQQLKGKESELMQNIEKNRIIANRVNKAIQVYIEAEMAREAKKAEDAKKAADAQAAATAKAGDAARPPVKPATGSNVVVNNGGTKNTVPDLPVRTHKTESNVPMLLTPTDVALASRFEENKGKLYWPVEKGYITDHFGAHPHPVYRTVIINNTGVDIQTDENAAVRSVFDGEVTSVFSADGSTQVVMVSHGNYFTVYNGLAAARVKKGDHVTTKQVLGTVGHNLESVPMINFQVWKSGGKKLQTALNPEQWIGKIR